MDTQNYGLIGSHNSYSYMHWSNKEFDTYTHAHP